MADLRTKSGIHPYRRNFIYTLVFFSGFSSLSYEIVWQRYLSILLGGQAKASVLVIALFLGGMGFGYLQFGKWSRRFPQSLFLVYAGIEMLLAIWALMFPFLFKGMLGGVSGLYGLFGLDSFLIDILSTVLLIGLPTFLMGGVLPVLTQAIALEMPDSPSSFSSNKEVGKCHARLYGFNTIGAALGCLFTGFVFIPLLSFRGSLFVGAVINLLIAVGSICFLYRKNQVIHKPVEPEPVPLTWDLTTVCVLVLAFLSGFIVTGLESVLLRVMALSTGSSNYNFTLLLASFIFCLGFSPMVVRNFSRLNASSLMLNQFICGFGLMALYVSADYWAYGVHWIRILLRDSTPAFFLYQGLLGVVLLILMWIPIGAAGLTLPLCFQLLSKLKNQHGVRVGQIYGINAIGAVLGSLLGGYLFFYFLNADQIFKIIILLTFCGAGMLLLLPASRTAFSRAKQILSWGALGLGAILVVRAPLFHKERFLQPFRFSVPMEASYQGAGRFGEHLSRATRILSWRDGPNGSVTIGVTPSEGTESSRTLFVNGKSDGNSAGDFFTMAALGHLAGLLPEQAHRVCVIGLGTGITASVAALYPEVRKVDVIEISETVIKALPLFDNYNGNYSTNPKSQIHQMDALRYLTGTAENFDVILSEPSNPWVVGVENLYSSEFYRLARKCLNNGGLFVQWIHSYSFNDELMRMVLKTISMEFPYVSVFQLKGGDLALVAGSHSLGRSDFERAKQRMRSVEVEPILRGMRLTQIETLLGLEIIPPVVVNSMTEGSLVHHLESPKLSNKAAQAFFANSLARPQIDRRRSKHFISSVSQSLLGKYLGRESLSRVAIDEMHEVYCGNGGIQNSSLCDEVKLMRALASGGGQKFDDAGTEGKLAQRELAALTEVGMKTHRNFTSEDLTDIYEAFEVYKKYASPVVRIAQGYFMKPLDYCLKTVSRKQALYGECLLNKLWIMDNFRSENTEFLRLSQVFMEWMRGVPETEPHLHKLEVAREALTKLLSEYE